MPKKYKLEEIKEIAKEKGYMILSKRYFGSNSKLSFKHIYCGYEFKKSWADFVDSGNCKKCAGLFVEISDCIKLAEKNGFEILSKRYMGSESKLKIKHLSCGYEFRMSWDNFKQRKSCPQCSKKVKPTLKMIRNIAKKRNYRLLSKEYKNSKIKLKFIHLECGNIYLGSWDTFKIGVGCGICFGRNSPTLDFRKNFSKDKGFTLLSEDYSNSRSTRISLVHDYCGSTFETSWASFYGNNSGCPKCLTPKGETAVEKYLILKGFIPEKDYFTQYFFEDCKNERYLYFDFYVPSKNLCIEYNGKQHYEAVEFFGGNKEFEKNSFRDSIKKDYCFKNNISLLVIPHWEKDKIPEILERRLQLHPDTFIVDI